MKATLIRKKKKKNPKHCPTSMLTDKNSRMCFSTYQPTAEDL